MHIGFRRSGGRGEYEVVGSHSGYNAISLEGWHFYMRWPDGVVRDTGLELEPAGSGKPRLRSTWTPAFQIGRMVSSMLLLPVPRRAFSETNSSLPVARASGYVLTRLGFSPDTEFTGVTDRVTIDPSYVTIENQSAEESMGVKQRWERIQAIYDVANQFPQGIRSVLDQHRDFLATGQPVTGALTTLVTELVKAVDPVNLGDPLPALERMAQIVSTDAPLLPPPDQIGEEDPEVSIRAAVEYRLAKARGAGAVKFGRDTRSAYGNRCVFCGGAFGGIPGVRSGVDAAHILAWHKYDLDVVANGLCLCKLHHWAFDEAIILPLYKQGALHMAFTPVADALDGHSRNLLGQHGAAVPTEYLPTDKAKWPSAKYLTHLYADLAISPSA